MRGKVIEFSYLDIFFKGGHISEEKEKEEEKKHLMLHERKTCLLANMRVVHALF